MSAGPPLLEARGLTKVYGRLVALRDADLALRAGEVRALVGSNGAGKSTLIKILTGAVAPTAGTVAIGGVPAPTGDPKGMLDRGIACIYQHSNLVPALTVLDNLALGRQPTRRFGLLDRKRQRREAAALLIRHGLDLPLDAAVGDLTTVQQKEVEILKALAREARVLLMDEPTAWLSANEVGRLFATIRALKARGVAVVYISHMLDEIFAVCDTVTVMRDGAVVAETDVAAIDRPRLVQLMVGETLAADAARAAGHARRPRGSGEVRLEARGLGRAGVFRDVSFQLHGGEILCLTGLIGSKRTELVRCLFGADRLDDGSLLVDGRPARFAGPRAAMARRIGFVPEDRHREGLMLSMSVAENLVMATLGRMLRHGLLRRSRIARAARALIERLSIRPPEPERPVRLLSGGNQQKVLVGKWLGLEPRVLILDEPTVGVDVGAKAEIYALLRAERDRGAAVLVVSSDLEEVMTIADRIGVMVAGRLVALHDAGAVDAGSLIAEIGREPA